MKLKYISLILILLILVGCGKDVSEDTENVSEEETVDNATNETLDNKALFEQLMGGDDDEEEEEEVTDEEEEEEEVTDEEEEEEELDNKALFEQLMGGDDDEEEEEEEEEIVSGLKEVKIENFRGDPDDFTITSGTTVKWTSYMYYNLYIVILPKEEDGTYASKWVNELQSLWFNDTYEYTFNETGTYKWGAKGLLDKIVGTVTVNE